MIAIYTQATDFFIERGNISSGAMTFHQLAIFTCGQCYKTSGVNNGGKSIVTLTPGMFTLKLFVAVNVVFSQ
jgi:hypothetical protein